MTTGRAGQTDQELRLTPPSPVTAGDHFRSAVGVIAVAVPPSAGDVDFVVGAVPDNPVKEMSRTHGVGADGPLVPLDVHLAPAAGPKLRPRVAAGAWAGQDRACWPAPTVAGSP